MNLLLAYVTANPDRLIPVTLDLFERLDFAKIDEWCAKITPQQAQEYMGGLKAATDNPSFGVRYAIERLNERATQASA